MTNQLWMAAAEAVGAVKGTGVKLAAAEGAVKLTDPGEVPEVASALDFIQAYRAALRDAISAAALRFCRGGSHIRAPVLPHSPLTAPILRVTILP